MKKWIKNLKFLGLCVVCTALILLGGHYVGVWQARQDAAALKTGEVREVAVKQVIDGDTLLLQAGDEKLRLTGIDAPESAHWEQSKNTVYGALASDHLKELVRAGSSVWIYLPDRTGAPDVQAGEDVHANAGDPEEGAEADTGSASGSDGAPRDRDNYDRLLRLVWKARPDISGGLTEDILRESLNGRMLLDGYAVAYIMDEEPWGDIFYRFQKEAMDSGAGLWADPGWIAHAAVNELIQ